MKGIFKINEYLKDTKQILVKFCKFDSNKLIDNYSSVAVDIDKLDTYNLDFFIKSLARIGTSVIEDQEKNQIGINEIENIDNDNLDKKLNIDDLIEKNIEFKLENYKFSILKMKRIEL